MHLPTVVSVAVPRSVPKVCHFRNCIGRWGLSGAENANPTSHRRGNSQRLPTGFAIAALETQTNRARTLSAGIPKTRKNWRAYILQNQFIYRDCGCKFTCFFRKIALFSHDFLLVLWNLCIFASILYRKEHEPEKENMDTCEACRQAGKAIIFDFSCFIKLYFINLHRFIKYHFIK